MSQSITSIQAVRSETQPGLDLRRRSGTHCRLPKKDTMFSSRSFRVRLQALNQRTRDIELNRLAQKLRNNRWYPILLGCVGASFWAALMIFSWQRWDYLASFGTVFCFLFGGFRVFWKTPARKAISTGVLIGTLVPIIIWLGEHG